MDEGVMWHGDEPDPWEPDDDPFDYDYGRLDEDEWLESFMEEWL